MHPGIVGAHMATADQLQRSQLGSVGGCHTRSGKLAAHPGQVRQWLWRVTADYLRV
jgi:hypothetical protein